MYDQDEQEQFGQHGQAEQEHTLEVASDTAPPPPDVDVVDEKRDASTHGECCDECKRTCKRNFWTSILNAVIKVSTIVLAAFGIQSFGTED